MQQKIIILHIPHSGIKIPLWKGFVLGKKLINDEILKTTDWYTDDLYNTTESERIIFNYSRIFCDPERFSDDSKESMAKAGMGVLYEKTDDNQIMRVITPEIRKIILDNYYWKHHKKLTQAVENQLKNYNKAIILDCHSFPDIPLNRSENKKIPRPDINIGTDSFHTPQRLLDISLLFFKSRGYDLKVNAPFSGSIVPMEYYRKEKKVESIMLEINRKLYLEKGTNIKSENYLRIKNTVSDYIELIKKQL